MKIWKRYFSGSAFPREIPVSSPNCNTAIFGSDPAPGYLKKCRCRKPKHGFNIETDTVTATSDYPAFAIDGRSDTALEISSISQ